MVVGFQPYKGKREAEERIKKKETFAIAKEGRSREKGDSVNTCKEKRERKGGFWKEWIDEIKERGHCQGVFPVGSMSIGGHKPCGPERIKRVNWGQRLWLTARKEKSVPAQKGSFLTPDQGNGPQKWEMKDRSPGKEETLLDGRGG